MKRRHRRERHVMPEQPVSRAAIRRRRRFAKVFLAALAALALAVAVSTLAGGSEDNATDMATEWGPDDGTEITGVGATASTDRDQARERKLVRAALASGVRKAEALGGTAEAVAWSDRWNRPVAAGDGIGSVRMWSMSKPVVAIALLDRADATGEKLSPGARNAMRRAIVRSENCRQRQIVLTLQELAGGAPAAVDAISDTLTSAGADPSGVSTTTEPVSELCRPYLQALKSELKSPLGDALLLGTSEWTVGDAASFMHSLGDGELGDPGEKVLKLMRLPKQRSTELTRESDYTAAADWGAGRAFAGLPTAYKAGWGGVQQGSFVAGQMVLVTVRDQQFAVAVIFKPRDQPSIDDPGLTPAPEAVEAVMDSFRAAVE